MSRCPRTPRRDLANLDPRAVRRQIGSVLQNGRLVESGTYRELIQRRGLFATLAKRQIA